MSDDRQLQMLWPAGRSVDRASLAVPEGYHVRPADEGSVAGFRTLMARVELGTWDDDTLVAVRATVVPGGWTVVVYERTGAVVATGMAHDDPQAGGDRDGHEVGWIAADPDHGGRGLGRAVTAAATERLVRLGASRIYLRTDDFRLPALKTYLTLGFVPDLWAEGMAERWRAVCERLGMRLDVE